MELRVYNFVQNNKNNQRFAKVKELPDKKGKYMVEYVNSSEELMTCIDIINNFIYRNEDGDKMWKFDKITSHKKMQMTIGNSRCSGTLEKRNAILWIP